MNKIVLCLCLVGILIAAAPLCAQAEGKGRPPPAEKNGVHVPSPRDDALGGPVYRQTPSKIRVDYKVKGDAIKLYLTALPALMACGTVSPIPVMGWLDEGVLNVEAADYTLRAPVQGSDHPACGTAYKIAKAEINIPRPLLKEKEIHLIRLWYKNGIDAFSVTWPAPDKIQISGPSASRFFVMGKDLSDQ